MLSVATPQAAQQQSIEVKMSSTAIDTLVAFLLRLPATLFGTVIVLGTLAVLALFGATEYMLLKGI